MSFTNGEGIEYICSGQRELCVLIDEGDLINYNQYDKYSCYYTNRKVYMRVTYIPGVPYPNEMKESKRIKKA
ncbi:hypothetical protein GSQ54_00615 [Clostridioides difficile]|uniref:hypothetical protein n=1 Tax=unclassified Clostridioides TaxID=2635829 RepID=UPI001696707E|nr:hypothetical protein [Clostridioides sp. ES-S-0171-01]MCC0689481.1 hypothetical protein [Clostridioides sp. ES-S-0056-01]NJI78933.1 hypothetical protein [Clostridioides difficile]UDN55845.1 hypothetical protein JJC02_06640 [Clostridioides sp. ES-S-0054-01]